METIHACKEAIFIKRLCLDVGIKQSAMIIYCDNKNAIYLANNLIFHAKAKHIDVQYNFFRDMVEDEKVKLVKIDNLMNVSNYLTKVVRTKKFIWCLESTGLSNPSN